MLLTVLASLAATRRYLRRLRAAERRARSSERMAEIGAMTGGLAHEIKNPLSTIGLNAQLLAEAVEELPIADDARARMVMRVGALRREADRLRDILADFLAFAGKVHLEIAPHDLNQIVSEIVDFYAPEAQRHAVRLRSDLSSGPIFAPVDPRAIKQALLNLMINATQAIAGGRAASSGSVHPTGPIGEVILRSERARDGDGGEIARLHVIDTGPGIAPDVVEKIFTPYFTTKSGGSGLGLPTSRRLIEEHGGRIDVHSEPGKGSDFAVVLPMRRDEQIDPAPSPGGR